MNLNTQSPPLPPVRSDLHYVVHSGSETHWYAVKSADGRYLRMGRVEYLITSALNGQRSAADIVAAVQAIDTDLPVTQEDVVKVVSWLGQAGLIASPNGAPPATPARARFSFNPIYTKIPLIPGKLLERLGAWFTPLVCWPVFMAMALLWLMAGASVLANWRLFAEATSRLFVSDRWMWWGAAWLVLKTAHEMGHAVMAVRVGSQIRSAGISLIFMAPIPFVDLSDLWTIPNRMQRMLCCAGGMVVELTLASLAAIVAVSTDNQSLQYFCCALATMGTVTTLAFNASPLIRFDGYFIFSDLINYPNLYTDAQLAAKQCVVKCVLPWRPARHRMSIPLVLYGLACYQYRIVMMVSLAVGTILAMQGVGVALVAWGAYAVVLTPLLRLRTSHNQASQRAQSAPVGPMDTARCSDGKNWFGGRWEALWGGVVAAGFCLLICVLPAPLQPSIPGYVDLRHPQWIRSDTEGFLVEVFVSNDSLVTAGELVARLSNPELELELALKENELTTIAETIALRRAQGLLAELQAAEAQRDALRIQVAQLERRVADLQVRSPGNGRLVRNELNRNLGMFLKAGEPLAMVARPGDFEVIASIGQHDVQRMRTAVGGSVMAQVSGGERLVGMLEKVEPRASDQLQQPLLAAIYGGPIAVKSEQSASGREELRLLQPRFDCRLRLQPDAATQVIPGQRVSLHIPGRPATLLDAFSRWCQHKWHDLQRHADS